MGWLLEGNVGSREGFPPSDGVGGLMSRSHSRERSRCYRRGTRSPSEGSLEEERGTGHAASYSQQRVEQSDCPRGQASQNRPDQGRSLMAVKRPETACGPQEIIKESQCYVSGLR